MTGPGSRPFYARFAIRFAAEGVPVAVIARGLGRELDEVGREIDLAIAQRLLSRRPADDWSDHALAPTVSKPSQDAVFEADSLVTPLMLAFNLTALQASILAMLMVHGCVTRGAMMHRACPTAERKTIDVHLLHLRRRLAPFGIEIQTIHGRGVLLADETRAAVLRKIKEGKTA